MERKELCIISDSDIPSGSGGINGEGYTYGQLRHQPIITEILQRITHPIARQMAEECNERNRRDGFTMYKVDGEYCFEGLRVGPKVKIPSKEELLTLLGDQPINAATIRNYCCPIKPLYTAISSLNPAEIGMISSYFKFQAPH